MADEKEINNQEELNKKKRTQREIDQDIARLASERLSLSSAFNDTIKELLGVQSKRTTFDSNLLKINRQINTAIYNSKQEFSSINELSSQIKKNQDVINKGKIQEVALTNALTPKGKDAVENAKANLDVVQNLIKAREDLIEAAARGEKIEENSIENLDEQIKNREAYNDSVIDGLNGLEKQVLFTRLNNDQLDKTNETLKNLKKESGGASLLNDALGSIPGVGDASKEAFGKFSKELQGGRKFGAGLMGAFKGMGRYLVILGGIIARAFAPLYIAGKIVSEFKKADEQVTKLAKSLALTKNEAVNFRSQLERSANLSGDLFVTSTKLLETFNGLNKQFGFITKFTNETLTGVTKLTQKVGTSAEAANNLALASERTGKSFDSNYKDVLATSYALQRQTGIQFDLLDVVEEVGKVTGQTRALLQANPKLIAEAVTQAKLLGAELDDVVGISKQLLEFESSIERELQAELLLGRDINLERARAAALQGDFATVAQEVAKQAGNFSDFSKLNVIQQEALAEATGLSVDKLSDALLIQEAQGRSAEELRAIGRDDLANRLEQTTTAQKFQAVQEKILSVATDLAVAFTPLVDALVVILDILNPIFILMEGIFALIRPILSGIGIFAKGISGALDGIGEFATDGAIKAIGDANNSLTSNVNAFTGASSQLANQINEKGYGALLPDVLGPKITPTGKYTESISGEDMKNDLIYGVQGNLENIYYDNQDNIQALQQGYDSISGNVMDNINQIRSQAQPIIDAGSEKASQLQSETNGLLKQILNKSTNINLDSQKMSTISSTNTFNIQ